MMMMMTIDDFVNFLNHTISMFVRKLYVFQVVLIKSSKIGAVLKYKSPNRL